MTEAYGRVLSPEEWEERKQRFSSEPSDITYSEKASCACDSSHILAAMSTLQRAGLSAASAERFGVESGVEKRSKCGSSGLSGGQREETTVPLDDRPHYVAAAFFG